MNIVSIIINFFYREIIRESYHVEKDLEEQNTVKIIKISDSITENLETNKIQKDSMPVEQPKKKKNIITKIFKTVRNISKPSYDEDKKKKREILMSWFVFHHFDLDFDTVQCKTIKHSTLGETHRKLKFHQELEKVKFTLLWRE